MISALDFVWEKRWVFGRRYLWRVGVFAVAALGFAWIVTHSVTTTYRAETEIAYKSTNYPFKFDLGDLLNNLMPLFLEDDIYYNAYDVPSVIASDRITYNVLARNNLKDRLYDPETDDMWEEWFEEFHAHLYFKLHSDTKSITIAYDAETPELAKEITQLFGEEFEKYFASLHWRKSLADGIDTVVQRRIAEIARMDAIINQTLIPQGRIAVMRSVHQDIHSYLWAERARFLAKAKVAGFDVAIEEIGEILDDAVKGEKISIPREASRDYILAFLKKFYYEGQLYKSQLEAERTEEHPEVLFWNATLGVTEDMVERMSGNTVMVAYNSVVLRKMEAQAKLDFWTERSKKLELRVAGLPQFEVDVYWLVAKKKFLEFTLWFWERRQYYQKWGETFTDDPFIVLDEPIIPQRAYYPILEVWVYAFPVLLVIGTMIFLLRFKLEEECIADIEAGKL